MDRLAWAGSSSKPRLALYDAGGTGGQGEFAVERLLHDRMEVVHVGPDEIAGGSLPNFKLLLVPGGSGSREAAAIGPQGRQAIHAFVEQGGGYMGICAGAFLCTSGYDWGLKILNAKTVSPKWERGAATLKIELTPEGRKVLGDRSGLLDVRYHNGPVVTHGGAAGLSDYEVWAWFRTEVAEHGTPAGVMVDSPAIASGRCGQGRVVFISPHPEQTPGLEEIVRRAAGWAAGEK